MKIKPDLTNNLMPWHFLLAAINILLKNSLIFGNLAVNVGSASWPLFTCRMRHSSSSSISEDPPLPAAAAASNLLIRRRPERR